MLELDWLALNLVSGLGIKTLNRLLSQYSSVSELIHSPAEQIQQKSGIPHSLALAITQAQNTRSFLIEKRLFESDSDLKLICYESENYPKLLKEIASPPLVLYCKGSLPSPQAPCLAFVGSRTCTVYGKRHTKRLIEEIAQIRPDTVVVSGLARGIDTVAHETALELGLKTIAVLAGGLQHIYPPENIPLAHEITKQGALISEFPLALKPLARNFPIRNRIISGLSLGTTITESKIKSGARITAGFALNQNREVFALPGPVDSPTSAGPNQLIASSAAKLVVSGSEILEELQLCGNKSDQTSFDFAQKNKQLLDKSNYSAEQWLALETIHHGVETIDSIHIASKIPIDRLLGILVELELTGILDSVGGQIYRLAENMDLP
ncbi:MAG: DNA-protecting protein DprA [SAR324 cluster bacterium]|nr:DNA-protecting protein DprA [SAR324 cluster bacterium]